MLKILNLANYRYFASPNKLLYRLDFYIFNSFTNIYYSVNVCCVSESRCLITPTVCRVDKMINVVMI